MKAIKLSIIFLVLVGGLILALNWESIIKTTSGDDDFLQEDLIDISAKCNEIRKAWEQCLDWDEGLYKSIKEDIDQSKSMGLFSREGYNTVNNTLRESAINKACDGYLATLHNKTFSDSKLQKYYKSVLFIKKYEKLDDDLRVKDVEVRNELYRNIKQFVNRKHTILPKFNTEKANWTSFVTLQSGILKSARNYRQNKLYIKEMTHIPDFESGLDETNLKKSTNKQRGGFYRKLCSQIIDYFRNETPTPDNVNLLNRVYKDFTDQESDYGVADLAAFKVSYGED